MNWTEKQLERHLRKYGLPGADNDADVSTPPFAIDGPDVELDLPPPLSVNRIRRIDWAARPAVTEWRRSANALMFLAKARKLNPLRFEQIPRFELWITLDEGLANVDMDNTLKVLIDHLVTSGVVLDDAPANLRGLHVVWGEAETGCRVTVRPCQ